MGHRVVWGLGVAGIAALIVLGIDGATRTASVGLVSDNGTLAERSVAGARQLAATALPLVEEVVAQAGCSVADVDLIAVSAGPGSFTGLRIGMSVAKGIAFATGAKVIAVPTLEALALVAGARSGVVCPVLDARKGEVYAAIFDCSGTRPKRLVSDCAVTPAELAGEIDCECVMIGDGVDPYIDDWRRLLAPAVDFLPFSDFHPLGSAVASLGRQYYEENGPDSLAAMVPRYCRPPEAEQKRLEKSGHMRGKAKIDRADGLR